MRRASRAPPSPGVPHNSESALLSPDDDHHQANNHPSGGGGESGGVGSVGQTPNQVSSSSGHPQQQQRRPPTIVAESNRISHPTPHPLTQPQSRKKASDPPSTSSAATAGVRRKSSGGSGVLLSSERDHLREYSDDDDDDDEVPNVKQYVSTYSLNHPTGGGEYPPYHKHSYPPSQAYLHRDSSASVIGPGGHRRLPTLYNRRHSSLQQQQPYNHGSRGIHSTFERRYGSLPELLTDFCARTSSHGIPHIAESATLAGKIFWSSVFVCCFFIFLYQTYFTVSTFLRYKTIVEMELKFEAAPFPAVTVCNLNPYKHSLVMGNREVEQTLSQFYSAIDSGRKIDTNQPLQPKSGQKEPILSLFEDGAKPTTSDAAEEPEQDRSKRQVFYKPIYAQCRCVHEDCVIVRNHSVVYTDPKKEVCICFQDRITGSIWPCYKSDHWSEEKCSTCGISNNCRFPEDKSNRTGELRFPCLCQNVSRSCVLRPDGPVEWYKPETEKIPIINTTPSPTPPPEVVEALGIETVQDTGSITTKTKENIILIVAALPDKERERLSYNLNEFVFSCTFNMGDCNLERDFKLHLDPVFGNCYSFNWNDSVVLKNTRAGPMYGLRLLLNVNQTDYLPSTEAAGIRLVVHEQDDEPFPDTFGYSAPTGAISSFGLKTKVVSRLGPPYGKCVEGFRPDDYIYDEFYSTEGCYRNCFQHRIVEKCGCGDPRFPLPPDTKHRPCKALNITERNCLLNGTAELGGYYSSQVGCECVQPCKENLFETAYSAADWPAQKYKTGECPPHINASDTSACTEYFRLNTAFIEIYYEQLNFENLRETEAYSIVNLLSDFGGNIGLWIGFSAITAVECFELFIELFYLCWFRKQREKRRAEAQYEMHYVNRIAADAGRSPLGRAALANIAVATANVLDLPPATAADRRTVDGDGRDSQHLQTPLTTPKIRKLTVNSDDRDDRDAAAAGAATKANPSESP